MKVLNKYLEPSGVHFSRAVFLIEWDDGKRVKLHVFNPNDKVIAKNEFPSQMPQEQRAEIRLQLKQLYKDLYADPVSLARLKRAQTNKGEGIRKNKIGARKRKIKAVARDLMINFSVDPQELEALLNEVLVETVQES